MEKHAKFLKHQLWREIKVAQTSIPVMCLLMSPLFMLQLHGYSKLYYGEFNGSSYLSNMKEIGMTLVLFVLWADFGAYWIHRLSQTILCKDS